MKYNQIQFVQNKYGHVRLVDDIDFDCCNLWDNAWTSRQRLEESYSTL